ncbi:hypothetical protein [Aliidiomarina quisquiliarum]|uniref:hypothetical protein n=1 Tax=Aliidiomarina quisquiliarum TaxID=2938947 RepID=UPI00208F57CF|nr:hypothetical protein [Aliidiomarina quisquiliarum]MCO4321238.1 hypothetical protein [Aliidiomarina quisquiliarum]
MAEIDLGDGVQRLPFGRINAEWEKFKSRVVSGDCIFFFTTDETTWEALHGREGYLLVRDGEPVDAIVTKVN